MSNEIKSSKIKTYPIILVGAFIIVLLVAPLYVTEQQNQLAESQNSPAPVDREVKISRAPQQEEDIACTEMVDHVEDLARIKDVRDTWLKTYFKKLVRLNIDRSQLELLAERAGISTLDSIAVLPMKSGLLVTQEELEKGLKKASVDETKKILSLLASGQLGYFGLNLGADADRKLYAGVPFFTFVLRNSPNKSVYLLSQLYSQGYDPTLFDLALSLSLNPGDQIISSLVQEIDYASVNWPKNGNAQVTLMLASTFSPDALSLWIDKTQAEYDPSARVDVLDFLPTPTRAKLTDAVRTVEVLLNAGQRVQTRLGYHHLMTWLPGDWVADNKARLVLPVDELTSEAESHLEELETKQAEYIARIQKTNQIIALCPTEFEDNIAKRKKELEEATISDREQQFQARAQSFKPVSALQNLVNAPMDASLGEYRDKLVKTLLGRNWEEALDVLPLFTQTEHADLVLDASIAHAVVSNAPYEFFESLLGIGASLPGNSLALMSVLGHAELVARLIRRGLDMNFVDPTGVNALGAIILSADRGPSVANPLFPLLLEAGVSAKPVGASLDPLNFVLQRVSANDFMAEYAKQLIAYGAPIEFSHIQQMQALKTADEALYMELVSYFPELEADSDE